MQKDDDKLILGFPVHNQATVFNNSQKPIGELNGPWLFKESQLAQADKMVPLAYLDYVKHWHVDAFVEKAAITTSPPKTLHLSETWTTIPMHPAQIGSNVEGLMIRDIGEKIELRVSIDLQSARIYCYPKK